MIGTGCLCVYTNSVLSEYSLVKSDWDCILGPLLPGSEFWSVWGKQPLVNILAKINNLDSPSIVLGESWVLLKCEFHAFFYFSCNYLAYIRQGINIC